MPGRRPLNSRPPQAVALATRLLSAAEAYPERLALRFGEERFSYAALATQIGRAASALREIGVRPGSRVALMLPNGPEFVACWLGLAWLGATLVPLNTRLRGEPLSYQLGHADVQAAV